MTGILKMGLKQTKLVSYHISYQGPTDAVMIQFFESKPPSPKTYTGACFHPKFSHTIVYNDLSSIYMSRDLRLFLPLSLVGNNDYHQYVLLIIIS